MKDSEYAFVCGLTAAAILFAALILAGASAIGFI